MTTKFQQITLKTFECEKTDDYNFKDLHDLKKYYKIKGKKTIRKFIWFLSHNKENGRETSGLQPFTKKGDKTYLYFDVDDLDEYRERKQKDICIEDVLKVIRNVINATFSVNVEKEYITKNIKKEKFHIHYPTIIVNLKTRSYVWETINKIFKDSDEDDFDMVDMNLNKYGAQIRVDGFECDVWDRKNKCVKHKEKYVPYSKDFTMGYEFYEDIFML